MDRRSFLRSTALVAGGAIAGGSAMRVVDGRSRDNTGADDAGSTPGRRSPLNTPAVISRVEMREQLVALTFDGGPMPGNTDAILDILKREKIRATFNIVGERAHKYVETFRRTSAEGHEIGNNSWSRPTLADLTASEVSSELRRTDDFIERVTTKRPRYVRPPHGDVSADVLNVSSSLGYDVLLWSLQLHESSASPEEAVRYVGNKVIPGTILLVHDTTPPNAPAGLASLPSLIDEIRRRGYTFVTVKELVSAGNPIQSDAL